MVAEIETPRDHLLKSMKRTKGVRFNASKRLEKRERSRTTTIAYASVSVIVLTIMPAFFVLPAFIAGMLALVTVGMSVVILTATLIQTSDAGLVKSDQFHRCALEVNALRRTLLVSEDGAADVAAAADKYNDIMQRYGLNHDPEDYAQYQREHPDEFIAELAMTKQAEPLKNEAPSIPLDQFPKAIAITTATVVVASFVSLLPTVVPRVLSAVSHAWQAVAAYFGG